MIHLVFRAPDIPPSLNGDDGLMRLHWSKRKVVFTKFQWLIASMKPEKIAGPVKLMIVNYGIILMDWENLAGRHKLIGDALVKGEFLEDDSPDIIYPFLMDQHKVNKKKDVRIEFTYESVAQRDSWNGRQNLQSSLLSGSHLPDHHS